MYNEDMEPVLKAVQLLWVGEISVNARLYADILDQPHHGHHGRPSPSHRPSHRRHPRQTTPAKVRTADYHERKLPPYHTLPS